jgi:predicted amidohydrolase YtcJ
MITNLVIFNARVRTLDPERPPATAIAMANGHITAVGTDSEVRAAAGRGA